MANQVRVGVVADDKATSTFKNIERGFARFRAEVNRFSRPLRAVGDTFGSIRDKIFSLQGAFVGVTAFLAGRGIKALIDEAAAMGTLARATGSTVEQLSLLQFALQASGADASELQGILVQLSAAKNKALRGDKKEATIFGELGIDPAKLNGAVDLFEKLAEARERFSGGDFEARLQALFPEKFARLLPLLSQGADALRQIEEFGRQSGAVISEEDVRAAQEFNLALLQLKTSATSVIRVFTTEFAGEFAKILESVAKFIRDNKEGLGRSLRDVAQVLTDAALALVDTLGAIIEVAEKIPGVDTSADTQGDRFRKIRDERIDEARRRAFGVDPGDPRPQWQRNFDFKRESEAIAESFEAMIEFADKFDPPVPASQRFKELSRELRTNIGKARQNFRVGDLAGGPDQQSDVATLIARMQAAQLEAQNRAVGDTPGLPTVVNEGVGEDLAALEALERRRAQVSRDISASLLSLEDDSRQVRSLLNDINAEAQKAELTAMFQEAGKGADELAIAIERVEIARRKNQERIEGSFGRGFQDEVNRTTQQWTDLTAIGAQFGGQVLSGVDLLADAFSNLGDETGRSREQLRAYIKDFARLGVQTGLRLLVGSILGGGAAPVTSARGNVFQNGRIIPHARGGVIDQPIAFPLRGGIGTAGEGGRPEAILPLKRGPDGALGVRVVGDSGGGRSLTINYYGTDPMQLARAEPQLRALYSKWMSEDAPMRALATSGRNR